MSGDEIKRLEAKLARLSGPARAIPLLQLGQQYYHSWWQNRPGSVAAFPYLNKAIEVTREGYDYLGPEDPTRRRHSAMFGMMFGARYTAHDGAAEDAEKCIDLIEGTLDDASRTPLRRAMAQITLGQVYLLRAMRHFHDINVMTIMEVGTPPHIIDGLDRAVEFFRDVIGTAPSPQMIDGVKVMLTTAEAFRELTRFGAGGFDFDMQAMMAAMAKLEELRRSNLGRGSAGFVWPGEWMTRGDPLDWPTAVITSQEPEEDFQPPERAPVTIDPDAMRRDLLNLLRDGDEGNLDGGFYMPVVRLLRSAEPPPWIDEFVALASGITYCAAPATGTDNFLLAAALHLRGRRDGAGIREGNQTASEIRAIEAILAAANTMLADDPDGIPALLFLATFLADDTMDSVAALLDGLSITLRLIGAEALVFPAPADALRWNTRASRLEPAAADGMPNPVVIIGQEPPAASGDDLIISYVASLAQLVELSTRTIRPVTERPVFLANPRGDRESASIETMLLRRTFYLNSRGFGQLIEYADGRGTSEEVLTAAMDASLLHIGCGIAVSGALELADGAECSFTEVTGIHGGLVVLPPGHFLPLADVLLAAGFTGVIGWCRPVSETTAALATFVLHMELVDRRRPPAEAVREARRWLRQPDRTILPSLLAARADELDRVCEADWTSLVYRGR